MLLSERPVKGCRGRKEEGMYLSAEIAQARVADLLRQAEDARRRREARSPRATGTVATSRRTIVLSEVLADEVAPRVEEVEVDVDAALRGVVQVGR
jgi:hypothetical protein